MLGVEHISGGMNGGQEGSRNYIKVIRKNGEEHIYGKVARLKLQKGDLVRLVTATGGGYGDPRKRPRNKVLEDLKNEYVTPEQANKYYGVCPNGNQ